MERPASFWNFATEPLHPLAKTPQRPLAGFKQRVLRIFKISDPEVFSARGPSRRRRKHGQLTSRSRPLVLSLQPFSPSRPPVCLSSTYLTNSPRPTSKLPLIQRIPTETSLGRSSKRFTAFRS
eukprot:7823134-Prorocentrum_lima.AAC.1